MADGRRDGFSVFLFRHVQPWLLIRIVDRSSVAAAVCECSGYSNGTDRIQTVRIAKERGLSAESADDIPVLGDELGIFPEYIKPVSEEKAQQFAMRHNPYNFNVIWGNRIKKA